MSDTSDADAVFLQIMEGQGLDLSDDADAIDFTKLSSIELSTIYNEARDELLARAEMRDATSARGRELHSLRAAALLELKRRKLR